MAALLFILNGASSYALILTQTRSSATGLLPLTRSASFFEYQHQQNMPQPLSTVQQEYLRSQLRYDHNDDPPPPNTLAVHQIQHQLIYRAVQNYAKKNEVHMLDIGCGWGDFSNQLDPLLATYVGIEPSPTELGRFHKRPNRFLVRGVGEYMDFLKDGSRNFILLNSVLDHCYNWRETYANCLRVLAPGGLLIVSMENSQKLIVQLRQLIGLRHVHEGHLEFFGVDDTRKLLEPDFEILEERTIGFLFGMHAVTKKIPLPVASLRSLNRAVNGFFRATAPKGGHIFFFAAIRKGATPEKNFFATPFRCPQCKRDLSFGEKSCACGLRLPYDNGGWLDAVELNAALKAALSLK
jgi:2-polyprenyl-3-methyl-5-hydroxy-6-metoxy-1,4-benzoquinol methylase